MKCKIRNKYNLHYIEVPDGFANKELTKSLQGQVHTRRGPVWAGAGDRRVGSWLDISADSKRENYNFS